MRDARDDDVTRRDDGLPFVAPADPMMTYGMGLPMEGPPPVTYSDADALALHVQELVDVNVDSARCFDEAVEMVVEQQLVDLFERLAKERRQQAEELARYLGDRGDRPVVKGTFTASLQRAWVKFKAALSEDDALMILDEAERMEDHVKDAYESLPLADVPDDLQQLVTEHRKAIHAGHARVSDLRDEHRDAAMRDHRDDGP